VYRSTQEYIMPCDERVQETGIFTPSMLFNFEDQEKPKTEARVKEQLKNPNLRDSVDWFTFDPERQNRLETLAEEGYVVKTNKVKEEPMRDGDGLPLMDGLLQGKYYGTPQELDRQQFARMTAKVRQNIQRYRRKREEAMKTARSARGSRPNSRCSVDRDFPSRPSTGMTTARSQASQASRAQTPVRQFKVGDVSKLHPVLLQKLSESWGAVNKAFKFLDVDRSGTIDIDEFEMLFSRFNIELTQEELQESFDVFDPEQTGEIHYDQFNQIVASIIHVKDEGGGFNFESDGFERLNWRKMAALPMLGADVPWNNRWRQQCMDPSTEEEPFICGLLRQEWNENSSPAPHESYKHATRVQRQKSDMCLQEWDGTADRPLIDSIVEGRYYKELDFVNKAKQKQLSPVVKRNLLEAKLGRVVTREEMASLRNSDGIASWSKSKREHYRNRRELRSRGGSGDSRAQSCSPSVGGGPLLGEEAGSDAEAEGTKAGSRPRSSAGVLPVQQLQLDEQRATPSSKRQSAREAPGPTNWVSNAPMNPVALQSRASTAHASARSKKTSRRQSPQDVAIPAVEMLLAAKSKNRRATEQQGSGTEKQAGSDRRAKSLPTPTKSRATTPAVSQRTLNRPNAGPL